jgi:hypothetical protein
LAFDLAVDLALDLFEAKRPQGCGFCSELLQSLFFYFYFSNRAKGLSVLDLCKTKEKSKTDQKL